MDRSFWEGKWVSVCGGASFIASYAIEALAKLDVNKIQVMDDFSSGNVKNLENIHHDRLIVTEGDLRSYIVALRATERADIVLDFSSVHGGRGFVGTNHDVAISDNLIINTNVLKAAVENHVERIAFSSSGCVYDTTSQMDDTEDIRITEDWISPTKWDICFPDGMYGLTKAVHEKTLGAYHRDGLIKTAICRFFTVFGPRMKENHFILASIAKSFIQQDPFYVWGTGTEVRNFTPVQNIVQGFLLATEKANGEAYNIGTEAQIRINDALWDIWDYMNWRPKEVIYQPDKPVGIRNRVSDCTKARTELGYKPEVEVSDALRDTINWYVSTHNVDDVRANLEKQMTSR